MLGDMYCRNCIFKVSPVYESNGGSKDENSSGFDSCSECQNCLAVDDLISTCKNDEEEMGVNPESDNETCFETSNNKMHGISSDKSWYLDINTAEICFGPRFSTDSNKRQTFQKKINKKNISCEYDLSGGDQKSDKDMVNLCTGSISSSRLSFAMKNSLNYDYKDPMNSLERDFETSLIRPPFGSPVENSKSLTSRQWISQFLLFLICLVSIFSLVFSQYKVLLLESRVKYLEETFNNRLDDFKIQQEFEIVSKLAQIQSAIEETVDKRIFSTINTVSGPQCYAIANNCAWNLVTTTPVSLMRKLAGS